MKPALGSGSAGLSHPVQSTGNGDRQAAGSRCAHRLLHPHVAPAQIGNRQSSTADSENRRRPADTAPGNAQPCDAGNITTGLGVDLVKHLQAHQNHENTDQQFQRSPAHQGRGPGANQGTGHNPRGHGPEQIPAHGTVLVVGANGADRGKDNGRQRGANRQMGNNVRIDSLQTKAEHQHRHDDQPAANAKQARDGARQGAKGQIRCYYIEKGHSLRRTRENQGWYDTQRKSQLH